ncbi:MAG: hypothetical protein LBC85_12135 [Fibromonadaceae bacterium]|jgi:hypothetical protein|nr:hypothetical protein [Fibromonadaceae bacterium]
MDLKDSAAIAYVAKPQMFTISVLKEDVLDILKSLANMKLIKLEADLSYEPNTETQEIIKKTDAGIDVAKFKSVKKFMTDLRN